MKRARPHDRDAALDAALNLFWMGMKPGSIYAAFSSKEALYLAALERYFQRRRDTFQTMMEKATSPLEALANHLRSFGKTKADDPSRRACMLVKTLVDTTSEEAEIAERSRTYLDALQADMTTAFDLAKSTGELPANVDTSRLARRFQSSAAALSIEAHRGTDQSEFTALADLGDGGLRNSFRIRKERITSDQCLSLTHQWPVELFDCSPWPSQ